MAAVEVEYLLEKVRGVRNLDRELRPTESSKSKDTVALTAAFSHVLGMIVATRAQVSAQADLIVSRRSLLGGFGVVAVCRGIRAGWGLGRQRLPLSCPNPLGAAP